jgi:hypothetical protein
MFDTEVPVPEMKPGELLIVKKVYFSAAGKRRSMMRLERYRSATTSSSYSN